MITSRKHLRRIILAAALTAAPAASFVAAATSGAPAAPTAGGKDLACVWVGQLNTGVCVEAPTKDVPAAIH
jgi:Flp pilus assembly protein CpaB